MGGAIVTAAWGAQFAATAWGTIVATSINMAIAAGISYGMAQAMARDVMDKVSTGAHLTSTRTTDYRLPLIYGTSRVAPNWVYIGNSGGDNKYLHMIGVLCEGPVKGIKQVDSVDQIFINDKLYTQYGGSRIYYEFFNGTSDQTACATLTASDPSWTDPLHYTAYIYLRLKYDAEYFNSIPNVTIMIEGLNLYDPTTGGTEFSNNPALCVYDMLTRPSTRGGMGLDTWQGYGPTVSLVVSDGVQKVASDHIILDDGSGTLLIYDGIQEITSEQINLVQIQSAITEIDSFGTAKTYCDTKGWTSDIIIAEDRPVMDNLNDLLATFRGALIYSEGQIKLLFRDLNEESAVMALTKDDIVEDSIEVSETSDLFDRPNALEINYLSKEGDSGGKNKYQVRTYVFSDADTISSDGDYRSHKVDLLGIADLDTVQKMAYYILERMRNGKTVKLRAAGRTASLEPMDIITLTYSDFGWSAEEFRVIESAYNPDGTVTLNLLEEDTSLYDDTFSASSPVWYSTTLPNAVDSPPNVLSASLSEEVYYYRGRSFTRLKVNFTRPAEETYPWWDHAEIWMAIGADSDYKFMTRAEADYLVDPVEEGESYWVKIRSVSTMGRKESLSSCIKLTKTISGKITAPTSMDSITAVSAGMNVKIYGEAISDPDIEGYELRLGETWSGGVFIGLYNSPYAQILSMRPGQHKFWMAPKGNNGYYASTAVSAQVTVNLPPGYSSSTSWAWNYDGIGVHDNTEYSTYNSTDALICSHTTGDLSGTWTSPIYDLSNSTAYLIYGDFRTIFTSTDKTFTSIFKYANDWNFGQILTDKPTFGDLWNTLGAGQLDSTILWGETSDGLSQSAAYFDISAIEITGRYVQVEVTITDPSLNSNLYLYTLNMAASTWS